MLSALSAYRVSILSTSCQLQLPPLSQQPETTDAHQSHTLPPMNKQPGGKIGGTVITTTDSWSGAKNEIPEDELHQCCLPDGPPLFHVVYYRVVATALRFAVVCWGEGCEAAGRNRLSFCI